MQGVNLEKRSAMQICIIGLGYVGLTLAIHAVKKKLFVHGVEIADEIYDSLSRGKPHFYEPGIGDTLNHHLNKNLFIYKKIPEKIDYDAIIITVGTPVNFKHSNEPRLDHLESSIETIIPHLTEKTLVVLRSTVPVGTTRKIATRINNSSNGQLIDVSFCPERTAEGQALTELQQLPQVVSGNTPSALKKAEMLFKILSDEVLSSSSLEEAELIKLFNNTFRDSMFSISNTFNIIAQSFGLDGENVINMANHNYPRSYISKPGFVAGPCLEKDAYILATNIKDEPAKISLLSARENNRDLEIKFTNKLKEIVDNNQINKILISGIAFKGLPPTNDTRGSSSINILENLSSISEKITIHDFMNSAEALKNMTNYESIETSKLLQNEQPINYEMIVILNNHPEYKSKKFNNFIERQSNNKCIIVDVWGVLSLKEKITITNIFTEVWQ